MECRGGVSLSDFQQEIEFHWNVCPKIHRLDLKLSVRSFHMIAWVDFEFIDQDSADRSPGGPADRFRTVMILATSLLVWRTELVISDYGVIARMGGNFWVNENFEITDKNDRLLIGCLIIIRMWLSRSGYGWWENSGGNFPQWRTKLCNLEFDETPFTSFEYCRELIGCCAKI